MIDLTMLGHPASVQSATMEEIVVLCSGLAKKGVNLDDPKVRDLVVDHAIKVIGFVLGGLRNWLDQQGRTFDDRVYRQLNDTYLEAFTTDAIDAIIKEVM